MQMVAQLCSFRQTMLCFAVMCCVLCDAVLLSVFM
jgi:hypothetical protein